MRINLVRLKMNYFMKTETLLKLNLKTLVYSINKYVFGNIMSIIMH